jgi:GAF domain-containing protein
MAALDKSMNALFSPETLALLELADKVVAAKRLEELADSALPVLTGTLGATAALLYLQDPRLLHPFFSQRGLPAEAVPKIERLCAEQFQAHRENPQVQEDVLPPPGNLALIPLNKSKAPFAFLGLVRPLPDQSAMSTALEEKIIAMLGRTLDNLLDRLDAERRLHHLNTYLNVSSMIAQALDLRDVLEATLYFCMDALTAEAASVLMLDFAKENFRFYSAEGEAKEVLLMATFPATHGLAGSVLETQQAEIINDVQNDPRFYGKFDSESGFQTRNMVVLPLTAGEEKIGVLEVLNKMGGKPFTEEELLLLLSIAEEIAFAIRNGKMFEVVVKSYCKQRQGLNTCKGCKRPLGSWTPCVKYREASGILE